MNAEEALEIVRNSEHDKVKIAVADIDGVLRGKYMHRDKFLNSVEGGFGFCNVVFGWDSSDENYKDSKLTGWQTGFPDAQARVDLSTCREIPWENEIPFFLADFNTTSDLKEVCPRTLFHGICGRAEEMGFLPMMAQEFEWFNFEETIHSLHEKNFANLKPLTPGMFGYSMLRTAHEHEYAHDLFELLNSFDIEIEGMHTETGPGVYEAAIKYDHAVAAGDKALLFKNSVKEIAYSHGAIATFMAKWRADLPGCSGHIHQSLWKEGKNVFAEENGLSETMKQYMAGQLHCLPEILPMLAPTVNSYKRLFGGDWAPRTLTWGMDNRTTALRALVEGNKSTRLETRVPGSDVNPLLAMAALLAAGLYGIKNGLKLQPETKGNGYEGEGIKNLPGNLQKATGLMRDSKIAIELFGKTFVDHYCSTREWEWNQFSNAVTDWEVKRYLEII